MEYILFSSTACVRLEFCSVAGRGRPQLFISYWTALSEPMHALLKSVPIMIFSIAHQDSQLVIEVFSPPVTDASQ